MKRVSWLLSLPPQLLPSFLHRSGTNPDKLHPTSYLDGLRGIAALAVFQHHLTLRYFKPFIYEYGFPVAADGGPGPASWLQLPFIRLVFTGRCWVHLFFIVSGYALSLKPLKQIRARQYSGLFMTLSSSVFRRALRLYLPLYMAVSSAIVLAWLGFKEGPETTFWTRLGAGLHSLYVYSNFFDLTKFWGRGQMEQHLWTIPLEMAFSMVLFIVILGLSRVKSGPRLVIVIILVMYSWTVMQWPAAEFLLGMFLAEVGLIQDSVASKTVHSFDMELGSTLPDLAVMKTGDNEEKATGLRRPGATSQYMLQLNGSGLARSLCRFFCCIILICGLMIFSWPDSNSEDIPLWNFLYRQLTPSQYTAKGIVYTQVFWHGIGAFQIIFACQQLPVVQALLSTRPPQYLGKVSYALYLLHQSVIDVFDPWIVRTVLFLVTGRWDGRGGGALVYIITAVLSCIPLIWVADLFWRFVDLKCVKIARNIEQILLVDDDEVGSGNGTGNRRFA